MLSVRGVMTDDSRVDALPALNQPVTLETEDGVEHPTRVQDIGPATLMLTRPIDVLVGHELGRGSVVQLLWTVDGGLLSRPVQIIASANEGLLGLWEVAPIGPAVRLQRRAHVRVPVTAAMTVTVDGQDHKALLVDLSEAALRCRVDGARPEEDDPLAEGARARVAFTVTGDDFDLPATVYRQEPVNGGVELVMLLDISEREATELRKLLFAEQVRLRRLRADS